jgi:simple sugar transport system permease protein
VHALLLLVGVGLLVLAVYQARRGRRTQAITSAVIAAGVLAWYLLTDSVPQDFTSMTPYVTTLLVLALASQRLRMPAADGMRYRRGEGA